MKYADDTVDEAHALRATGLTARAIGERLRVPTTTVEGWLAGRVRARPGCRSLFNERARVWRYPDETVAQARAMYAAGRSGPQVARRLGAPYPTVRDWLRSPTATCRPPGRPAPTHLES